MRQASRQKKEIKNELDNDWLVVAVVAVAGRAVVAGLGSYLLPFLL